MANQDVELEAGARAAVTVQGRGVEDTYPYPTASAPYGSLAVYLQASAAPLGWSPAPPGGARLVGHGDGGAAMMMRCAAS
jgi:hypothetical protein